MSHRLRSLKPSAPIGLVLAAALLSGAGGASAQFAIPRFTIDGGGRTNSTGGTFLLGGTIGQPDAGYMSGASFILHGGFWNGEQVITGVDSDTPGNGPDSPGAPPLAFRLYAASPNPLSEHTLIAFDLPALTRVRAALFDASGRLVRILADGPLAAGRHHLRWRRRDASGRAVASGIYFLRLEAGVHQATQKVVVVR